MATIFQQGTGYGGMGAYGQLAGYGLQSGYGQQSGYGYGGYAPQASVAYVPTTTSFTAAPATASAYPPRNESFTRTYVAQPQQAVQSVPRVASFTNYNPAPATTVYSTVTNALGLTATPAYTPAYAPAPTATAYSGTVTTAAAAYPPRNASFTRTASFTAPVTTAAPAYNQYNQYAATAPATYVTTAAPAAYPPRTGSFTSYPTATSFVAPGTTSTPCSPTRHAVPGTTTVVRQTSFNAPTCVSMVAMGQAGGQYVDPGGGSYSVMRGPPPPPPRPPPPPMGSQGRNSYPDELQRDPNARPQSYTAGQDRRRKKGICC